MSSGTRSLAVGLAAGMVIAAGGCSSSSSRSETTTTTANNGFRVTTPNGQVSVSLSGQLPPNWPSSFPIPADATPAGSGSVGGTGSSAKVAVYSTNASPQDTFAYYTDNQGLTTSGAKSAGVGTSYAGSVNITAPYTGSVTVVSHNSKTYIVVVLAGSK